MINVSVPRETVNDTSVMVVEVFKASGEMVQKGEIVVRIETSKTAIDIESPKDGFIEHSIIVGSEVVVGNVLFTVADEKQFPEKEQQLISRISNNLGLGVELSLNSAKVIEEFDISLDELKKLRWITSSDLKFSNEKQEIINAEFDAIDFPEGIAEGDQLKNKVISNSKRKKTEIQNLMIGNHASTTSVIGVNLRVPGERTSTPPYLFRQSILDLVVFEASRLLISYPELNARFLNQDSYLIYEDINIGISFDNGKNLKVLGVKQTNLLTLGELQQEIETLLDLYDSNKHIPLEVLTNSTVTISDLSQTSAAFVMPLINGMQSLIIAIVQPVPGSYSLFGAFDHRISEGLQVTKFLTELSNRVISHYMKDGFANISCSLCNSKMSDEADSGISALLKCTYKNGESGYICRGCFNGW